MTDEEYKASIQSKSTEELTRDLLGWIDGYFIDLAESTLRELERRVEEAQVLSELRSKVDGERKDDGNP